MSKHTPGPWYVDDVDQDNIEIIGKPSWACSRNYIDGEWAVAKADDFMGEHPEETAANARLIASAPDLLKALKAVVYSGDFDAAIAAIAKAEGQS